MDRVNPTSRLFDLFVTIHKMADIAIEYAKIDSHENFLRIANHDIPMLIDEVVSASGNDPQAISMGNTVIERLTEYAVELGYNAEYVND